MCTDKEKIAVAVIGELNVDIILNGIESLPALGKEISANKMSFTLGSSSAIFAHNLSSLGPKVSFIGKIGEDYFAQVILNILEKNRVDISQVIRSSSLSTGATIILNYNQDQANIIYPGAMNEFRLEDIDFDFLSSARHMHFSSCFFQPGIRKDLIKLFRRTKKLGLTTSFDPQWDPEEKWDLPLEDLLPYVDIFLPNIKEFQFLTRSNTVEEGIGKLKQYANYIIIKNGSDGALAWDGKQMIMQPAFINNNVVDCVGAGDSFNAGFIKDFIDKKPLAKCLETGALTGAVSTTRTGGIEAFENAGTFHKIARERFNYPT